MMTLFIIGGILAYIVMIVFTACWIHLPSDGEDCCAPSSSGIESPPFCIIGGFFWPIVLPCMIVYKGICKPLFVPKKIEALQPPNNLSEPYRVGDWKNEGVEITVQKTRGGKK